MKTYIIGSGGFAKEVLRLLLDTKKEYSFVGFIDYKPERKSVFADGKDIPVVDEDEFLQNNTSNRKDVAVFVGIGDPKKVYKVVSKYNGFCFPNLIHPSYIGSNESVILGEGNIITAGCVFTVDIRIGSFNIFNLCTTVGHDTEIGNYNIINPGVNISGGVTIGNKNLLGVNSTVLQYQRVGDNSILGAGAVLTKELPSNTVAVGVPAKIIKQF